MGTEVVGESVGFKLGLLVVGGEGLLDGIIVGVSVGPVGAVLNFGNVGLNVGRLVGTPGTSGISGLSILSLYA